MGFGRLFVFAEGISALCHTVGTVERIQSGTINGE
jgi:hypothetical protein